MSAVLATGLVFVQYVGALVIVLDGCVYHRSLSIVASTRYHGQRF